MKLFRKVVDERQELELMRIERSSFWVLFFALVAAMLIQSVLPDFDVKHIAGEIIVLAIVAVWMVFNEIRCGAWDYFTNPGTKVYVVYSLIGGFSGGSIVALMYHSRLNAPVSVCLKMFAITAATSFTLCFILLLLAGTAVKRKRERLQQESDEESQ